MNGTTGTVIGVGRECLWYVVRGWGDRERKDAAERAAAAGERGAGGGGGGMMRGNGVGGGGEYFPCPGPLLPTFDAYDFGVRGSGGNSIGIECWNLRVWKGIMEEERGAVIKGGSCVAKERTGDRDKEGGIVGLFGKDGGIEGIGDAGTRILSVGDSGSSSGSDCVCDMSMLSKLLDRQWSSSDDSCLRHYIERCAETCNVGTASCLSREMIGMGRGSEARGDGEGVEKADGERLEKEKFMERILSRGSSLGREDKGEEGNEEGAVKKKDGEGKVEEKVDDDIGSEASSSPFLEILPSSSSSSSSSNSNSNNNSNSNINININININSNSDGINGNTSSSFQARMSRLLKANARANLLEALRESRGCTGGDGSDLCLVPLRLSSKFSMDEIFARACLMIRINECARAGGGMMGMEEGKGGGKGGGERLT